MTMLESLSPSTSSLMLAGLVFLQVAFIILVASLLARKRSAAIRSSIWLSALVCVLASPVLTWTFHRTETGILTVEVPSSMLTMPENPSPLPQRLLEDQGPKVIADQGPTPSPDPTRRQIAHVEDAFTPEIPTVESEASPAVPATTSISYTRLFGGGLLLLWALGALASALSFARGLASVRVLRSRARPFDNRAYRSLLRDVRTALGLKELPRIATTRALSTPLAIGGTGRPMVLLPESILQADERTLRDILIHECAHIAQHDLVIGWFQRLASVLYWFHPALRVLNHELSRSREELCDDYVLRRSRSTDYARTLLWLGESARDRRLPASCGLFHHHWRLEERVQGLLAPERTSHPRASLWRTALASTGLLLIITLSSGVKLLEASAQPSSSSSDETTTSSKESSQETFVWQGRVIDPEGNPVPNAPVYFDAGSKPFKHTDKDGVFRITAEGGLYENGMLVSRVPGYGLAFDRLGKFQGEEIQDLRLVEDPGIFGRILDLEGRPVPGVRVSILRMYTSEEESLDTWTREHRNLDLGALDLRQEHLTKRLWAERAPMPEGAITDEEGEFTLEGVGKERLVSVRLDGDTIESQEIRVVTREIESYERNFAGEGPGWGVLTHHGIDFEHIVGPTQIIEGVVKDAEGNPLEGVKVVCDRSNGRPLSVRPKTMTDDQGAFRLVGTAPGTCELIFTPPKDQPFLAQSLRLEGREDLAPLRQDVELERGRILQGRITDRETGQGVQSRVSFYPQDPDEPFASEIEGHSDQEGHYRLIVGPQMMGYLGASSFGGGYVRAPHREDAPEAIAKGEVSNRLRFDLDYMNAIAWIEEPVELSSIETNFELIRCEQTRLRFVDEEGHPVKDVWIKFPSTSHWMTSLKDDHFDLDRYTRSGRSDILFLHRERNLSASLDMNNLKEDVREVVLRKASSIFGRIVDEEGRPLANRKFELDAFSGDGRIIRASPDFVTTAPDGTFRIEGLTSSMPYSLRTQGFFVDAWRYLFRDLRLEIGEERSMGDIVLQDEAR